MDTNILQAIGIVMLVALAGIGWSGYWIEFQQRIKYENKVKQFYGEV